MTFRDEYDRYTGSPYEQKIVAWMTEHGRPGYADRIRDGHDAIMECISEAGPNWAACTFTRDQVERFNTDVRETFQAATDRFEDWASD